MPASCAMRPTCEDARRPCPRRWPTRWIAFFDSRHGPARSPAHPRRRRAARDLVRARTRHRCAVVGLAEARRAHRDPRRRAPALALRRGTDRCRAAAVPSPAAARCARRYCLVRHARGWAHAARARRLDPRRRRDTRARSPAGLAAYCTQGRIRRGLGRAGDERRTSAAMARSRVRSTQPASGVRHGFPRRRGRRCRPAPDLGRRGRVRNGVRFTSVMRRSEPDPVSPKRRVRPDAGLLGGTGTRRGARDGNGHQVRRPCRSRNPCDPAATTAATPRD